MRKSTITRLSLLPALLVVATTSQMSGSSGESNQLTRSRVETSQRGFTPIMVAPDEGTSLPNALPAQSKIPAARLEGVEGIPTLYGTVIKSKAGADGSAANTKGMYSFTADGSFTRLNTQGDATNGGAPMADGFYYAVNRTNTGKIYVDKFNTSTWKRSTHTLVSGVGILASDVAYDPTSDMVYGCFYNDQASGYVFGKIDYSVRKRIEIKPLEMAFNAVMANARGQIYAIDMTGELHKVDKTTGDITSIGHTGVTPLYASSATIDHATGRCFWTVSPIDGNGYLYEVNLQTGEATLLTTFVNADEVTGIYVPAASPGADTPAAVTAQTPQFSNGSLSGTVSFTLPTLSVGSTPLGSDVKYEVWVNGVEVATGEQAPGASVSIPVTLTESGRTPFVVKVYNNSGEGKSAISKIFVGNDTPVAPTPSLTYANGAFSVTWPAVTNTVNKGYIDPDRVTYTVVRQPDNVVVAENISETSVIDPVEPTPGRMIAYKYQVRAEFAGNVGATGTTPIYPLGEIQTPWHEGFDSAESLNNFIILDANGDKTTWQYSGSMSSAYITNSSQDHDDWLISAALRLEAGVNYKLTFEALASFNPERIEVKMGKAPTPEGMTTTLVEPTELNADFSMNAVVPEFTVPESGLYYIGWHAISDANSFYMYLDNIALTDDKIHDLDAVDPPYTQGFDGSASLEDFTVIDANGDGYIWNIDQGEARVSSGYTSEGDWMITRPLNLKAGYNYRFSLKARAGMSGSTERFEVKAGTASTVEAMTFDVIPTTTVTGVEPTEYSAYFKPAADGQYRFGIHGISTNGGFMLYVDDLAVSAPIAAAAPAAATDLTLSPAMDGALNGIISFKAPTSDTQGFSLPSLDRVDVKYDGNVVYSFTSILPGADLSTTVTVPSAGDHTFTVVGVNAAGEGMPNEISAYFGLSAPNTPTDVTMQEDGDSGLVTLTWKAPNTDIKGRTLNPASLKYIVAEVINGQSLVMARDLTATTYRIQAVAPGATQQFKAYAVFALNEAGMSSGIASPSTPVGKPYSLPYLESFPNGEPATAMQVAQVYPEVSWSTYQDNKTEVNSVDSDNGFLAMFGANMDASGALQTAKISLADAVHPQLTFHVFNLSGEYPDNNRIQAQLQTADGQVSQLDDFIISDRFGDEYGWHPVTVDLTPYAGKTVRLALGATIKGYSNVLLDRIGVDDDKINALETIGLDGIKVATGSGWLSLTGVEGLQVTLTDISGCVYYNGHPAGDMTISLAPGLYIVRAGKYNCKVMVK